MVVVVVVVVVVVSIVVSVVVVVDSSSAVVSVTTGSETSVATEVSLAYCVADCAPQPATTTNRKVTEILPSFTLLTLVVRDPQKSEAH
ncbi:MAG TPA: hypothetical protein DEO42_08065 [Acidimicrobium sp.]|nr:MAG: hypothetical protein ABR56_10410 [Acidimicrobium sp. BACL27 MAG-120823-bin4]HBZ62736.1 hypothetical protein [Acidimicrobium sp.]